MVTKEFLLILIIFIIKFFRSILKKKMTTLVDENQFIMINTTIILILLIFYYIIKSFISGTKLPFGSIYNKWCDVDMKQKCIIICLSIFTILNSFAFFDLDKSENQSKMPLVIKSLSSVGVIIFSCLIVGEKITIKQIIGIIMMIFGLYLVNK